MIYILVGGIALIVVGKVWFICGFLLVDAPEDHPEAEGDGYIADPDARLDWMLANAPGYVRRTSQGPTA